MSAAVGVVTSEAAYRVAISELPMRTRSTDQISGSIVIVPGGAGWCDAVRAAADANAVAVVVMQPRPAEAESISALAADVAGLPVVLERPFLRADAVSDAVAARMIDGAYIAPRVVSVDCAADVDDYGTALRDAIGWLRVLAGGDLVLRTGTGGVGLFERQDADAPPALLTAVTVGGSSRVRAYALGEVLSEVDTSTSDTTLTTSTGRGRLVAPARYESAQRLALRRGVDALAGHLPQDLADYAADSALAEAVHGAAQSTPGHKHS